MSNYKKLGPYIREVDVRNTNLSVSLLLGVSIDKTFIDSHANTVGTDFKTYKIVKKGQFAYGPVTSRNGDKISIALLKEADECLISSSYTSFEIVDKSKLNPDYLMMLFANPEFDRYARYNSWGSAREVFSWDELCDSVFYIPDIIEQNRLVEEFMSIQKELMKLENNDVAIFELAKALLKSKYDNPAFFSDKECITIQDFCRKICSGATPSRSENSYWDKKDYPWLKNGEVKCNIILDTEEYISEKGFNESSVKLISEYSVNMAMYCVSDIQVSMNLLPITTNQAVLNMETDSFRKSSFLYFFLATFGNDLTSTANGSAQQNLSKEIISNYSFKKPILSNDFFNLFESIMEERISLYKSIVALNELKRTLLKKVF